MPSYELQHYDNQPNCFHGLFSVYGYFITGDHEVLIQKYKIRSRSSVFILISFSLIYTFNFVRQTTVSFRAHVKYLHIALPYVHTGRFSSRTYSPSV